MTSVESLNKALRDFAYAVPEDVRNAALTVAADLSAERKRREEAEERARDLQVKLEDYMRADKALTVASEKWKARAEQAERERDEARRLHGKSVLDGSAAVARAERAEADNAALLLRLRRAGEALARGGFVDLATGGSHPGATMLERMRMLEKEARINLNASHARHDYSHPRVETCPDARCVRLRALLEMTP